jgi:hypothetical protein
MTPQHSPRATAKDRELFPGPRPFQREEADLFFGRDRESADLHDLIQSYRTVLLYAQSGAGKSSLVNASLIPAMEAEDYTTLRARVAGAAALTPELSKTPNVFVANTLLSIGATGDAGGLQRAMNTSLSEIFRDEIPRLLIFDQFEEFFTSYPDRWREREPFFAALHDALRQNRDLHLLFVIREDHLAKIDPYTNVFTEGFRIRYHLERLRATAAQEAIIKPLAIAGYSFAAGVPEHLVTELQKERVQTREGFVEVQGEFVEPLHLQLVCRDLWAKLPKDATIITQAQAESFVDVDQALATFYDTAVHRAAKSSKVREAKLRRWFEEELITPAGTRGIVYGGHEQTGGITNTAVGALVGEHVLRAEPRAGAIWYELTHDRFIAPIRTANERWLTARQRRFLRYAVGTVLVPVALAAAFYLGMFLIQRSVRTAVEDSQKYQFLHLYTAPSQVRDADLSRAYWVPATQGGKEIENVRTSLNRLRQRGFHYGPESKLLALDVRYVRVALFSRDATVGTTEKWFLPLYEETGVVVPGKNPTLGPYQIDYLLRRIDGRWLIQSTTTPYVKK